MSADKTDFHSIDCRSTSSVPARELIWLDGESLRIEALNKVARSRTIECRLTPGAVVKVNNSAQALESLATSEHVIYGVNTGFGALNRCIIPASQTAQLSRNLITSHAVGVGPKLPIEQVRAAMLVRLNSLIRGHSGVRLDVINALLAMLNQGVTPVVHGQGSLASSGDLCLLAQIALVMTDPEQPEDTDDGLADFQGQTLPGRTAMQQAGIRRVRLRAKEGLALTNGASFTAAVAALLVHDAFAMWKVAHCALALSLEALLGCLDAFDHRIHDVRQHDGQILSAGIIRALVDQSSLCVNRSGDQDAYSLRCAPQVIGACFQPIQHAWNAVSRELNASTDNPLIFERDVLSGGNFHGEALGMAMDYLRLSLAELGAISERRVSRLLDPKEQRDQHHLLPDMLAATPGLHSGYMITQYTSAALVLENEHLASPDVVRSLPTSGNKEDHNSNGWNATRHTYLAIDNLRKILAIELVVAARGVHFRLASYPQARVGVGSWNIYRRVRNVVPFTGPDHALMGEIGRVEDLLPELASDVYSWNETDSSQMNLLGGPVLVSLRSTESMNPAGVKLAAQKAVEPDREHHDVGGDSKHETSTRINSSPLERSTQVREQNLMSEGGSTTKPTIVSNVTLPDVSDGGLKSLPSPSSLSSSNKSSASKSGSSSSACSSAELLRCPKGTRDFLPAQVRLREAIIARITTVFKKHGASAIDTPVIELHETLFRNHNYGEQEKLVYELAAQGGERLVLRYDLTVPFARYVATHNMTKLKRYHIAKVYRRDNPSLQQGRYREFFQCDYDYAGASDSMLADADAISVMIEILDTEVGSSNYRVRLSHRALLEAVVSSSGVSANKTKTVCSSIDKLDKLNWSEVSQELYSKGIAAGVVRKLATFFEVSVCESSPVDAIRGLRTSELLRNHEPEQLLTDIPSPYATSEAPLPLPDPIEIQIAARRQKRKKPEAIEKQKELSSRLPCSRCGEWSERSGMECVDFDSKPHKKYRCGRCYERHKRADEETGRPDPDFTLEDIPPPPPIEAGDDGQ